MKKMPFLRDVDDEGLYAQMLENCFLLAYEQLSDALAKFPITQPIECFVPDDQALQDLFRESIDTYERLARMRQTMAWVIKDCADRRRRLADRSVRLPDRVFDEEST